MIYSIYPVKDTTLYEENVNLNSGMDSILELKHEYKNITGSLYNSRILIKFDVTEIEQNINAGKISPNAKYYLSLRSADAREIPQEYSIYAYPLSGSWVNGTGKYNHVPITKDGASWKYRTSMTTGVEWEIPPGTSSFEWDSISQTWVDANILFGANLSVNVTSSYYNKKGGGTWWNYDNLECVQNYSFETADLYMDVTDIVKKWVTGSGKLVNDGFIVKFSTEQETSLDPLNSLKFFGAESNTIYVPRLNVVWNDQVFNTGSLSSANFDDLSINVKLKKFYAEKEKAKIKIYANKKYPQKNYTTQSYHTVNYYLPSSSYYEVRDAYTDEVILPFDVTGSKISCDSEGNYFNLWMNSFQPERFYRIVVKVEEENGDVVKIFDNNYYFKVTR